MNADDQYSIWSAGLALPPGWREAGILGSKMACLDYIDAHWNDMRPRSAREAGARPARVVEALLDRAGEHPASVAIVHGERRISYADFVKQSHAVGRALRKRGVVPGEAVIVFGERSPEAVIAFFGLLMIGAVYVPVDRGVPRERLRSIMQNAGAMLVLTADDSPELGTSIARLIAEDVAEARPAEPLAPVSETAIAYIIYTSGSTGAPKGVEVEHRSLNNLVAWTQTYGIETSDRVAHLCSIGFDVSIWDIVPTLTAGAELHIPINPNIFLPRELLAWIRESKITIAFMPTPVGAVFFEFVGRMNVTPLQRLFVGGEQLKRWPPASFQASLVNIYGPTEATVLVSATHAHEREIYPDATPSIGLPIANVTFRVLNDDLQEVPVGCVGQLFIEGSSLARGYRRAPALTAEKFLPSPFGSLGARMYASGDIVRRQSDERYFWLGRLDRQIKLRGKRIEPEEVERILCRHDDIVDAAVLPVRNPRTGVPEWLAGFVKRIAGRELDGPAVRSYLAAYLPDYMIPARTYFVESLPLTLNGKVDYEALTALT
jgi:amino acid adenylation domain-containing protein